VIDTPPFDWALPDHEHIITEVCRTVAESRPPAFFSTVTTFGTAVDITAELSM